MTDLEASEITDIPQPWDGFLVGPENALAHAAASALSKGEPGLSPLVVFGPSGAGKSRWLAGLVDDWLARRPAESVALWTGADLAARCESAGQSTTDWADLRNGLRSAGLLAIDDAPDLARRHSALDELSHSLDALEQSGAAVVLTARTSPIAWMGWPARLMSRLKSGLILELNPPGAELRRRFLIEQARSRSLRLPATSIERMAEAADGFQTLEGWVARLAFETRATGRPPTQAGIDELIEGPNPAAPCSPRDVARAVATRLGVRLVDLRGPSRRRELVVPRHLAVYLARELTGASFAALGRTFGGRDTKTIRHACSAAARRLEADPSLAATADSIRSHWSRPPVGLWPTHDRA